MDVTYDLIYNIGAWSVCNMVGDPKMGAIIISDEENVRLYAKNVKYVC
jgi:hypothetical protein